MPPIPLAIYEKEKSTDGTTEKTTPGYFLEKGWISQAVEILSIAGISRTAAANLLFQPLSDERGRNPPVPDSGKREQGVHCMSVFRGI